MFAPERLIFRLINNLDLFSLKIAIDNRIKIPVEKDTKLRSQNHMATPLRSSYAPNVRLWLSAIERRQKIDFQLVGQKIALFPISWAKRR
jgi:hypothetical protein